MTGAAPTGDDVVEWIMGAACSMCPGSIRNVAALVHNLLVRIGEPRAYTKLHDLKTYLPQAEASNPTDPVVVELLAAARAVVDAYDRGEGLPNVAIPRLRAADAAARVLSDQHFADREHSHGDRLAGARRR